MFCFTVFDKLVAFADQDQVWRRSAVLVECLMTEEPSFAFQAALHLTVSRACLGNVIGSHNSEEHLEARALLQEEKSVWRAPLWAAALADRATASGQDGAMGTAESDSGSPQRASSACAKRLNFLNFSYVCPEPVLVKCSYMYA